MWYLLQGNNILIEVAIFFFLIVIFIGHGTTNDGNTARTFFRNVEKSAEITWFNVNLVE